MYACLHVLYVCGCVGVLVCVCLCLHMRVACVRVCVCVLGMCVLGVGFNETFVVSEVSSWISY